VTSTARPEVARRRRLPGLQSSPRHQPDAGLDRVDAEPRPGEIAEGQARHDL